MSDITTTSPRPSATTPEARDAAGRADTSPSSSTGATTATAAVSRPNLRGLNLRGPNLRGPVLRGAAVFAICMAAIIGAWQAAITTGLLTGLAPGPADVWNRGVEILADPFYRDGPSSVGIFWHLMASLRRVLIGFAIAAAIAIPVGFLLGMVTPLRWGLEPLVQVLRPVSPLAWLPIGLALLRDSENTALFVIIMSALWPMLLQTISGVMGIDPLYRDLARTLGTNRRDTFRHILLPATLPSIVTGMRLSLSTAWLVIIAAEMLVGGRGMGYFVWNMWNRLDIAAIVVAIVIIGAVGFVLDQIISNIQKVLPSA